MFRPLLIPAALVAVSLGSLLAQEAEEMHVFTSKADAEGGEKKTVEARLLAISEDRRTIRIRRKDGLEFELEIVGLSLDDQQYVKDWIKTRPSLEMAIVPGVDYRLEIDIDKKSFDTERHEKGSYTYEQRNHQFDITVRNITRETLAGARLQYVILWKDALAVSQNSEGEWEVRYSRSENAEPGRIMGETGVADLPFNREDEIATQTYELNRVLHSSEVYQKDELIGIIVRVLSAGGSLIEELREGSAEIDDISWEKATFVEEEEDDD